MPAVRFEEPILPLHDHAQVQVIEHKRLCRDALHARAGELLDVHHEGSVAINVNDLLVGTRNLRADRARVAVAHRAEPEAADERARLVEIIELRRPHLVLAHARRDDRLALRHPVKLLDHVLRLDRVLRVLIVKWERLFPLGDLRAPRHVERIVARLFPLVTGLCQQRVRAGERVLHVTEHRQLHHLVLVDFGIVYFEMHDRAVLAERLDLARHAVVETHAECEQQVGLVHRVVRVHGAVHAEPFQR